VLEERAANLVARAEEDQEAKEATEVAEAEAVPGIYVYTLPHYWRYPYDEDSGRTLLKVGRSDRSVIQRFRDQTRTTALPEDPVLLRIYVTVGEEAVRWERQFHDLLTAADHDRSTARTGGTEWFLTSLKFLDALAGHSDCRFAPCSTQKLSRDRVEQAPNTRPRSRAFVSDRSRRCYG
jgi:hypothetical protein